MSIAAEPFGDLPGGGGVERFTLVNDRGSILKVINYGGIITELHVADRRHHHRDVVLGLNTLEEYLGGHPYFGAIVGRVAGRITQGEFRLDGDDLRLVRNDPPNHLHGGVTSLDKKLWVPEAGENSRGEPCLTLSCTSSDGEEGYPGNVDIKVTYTLTDENELRMEYAATTDRATPLSLTNHSYFNLAGEGSGSIEHHLLQIHTDEYVPTDQHLTLSGRIETVAGKPIDFTHERALGEIVGEPLKVHGDNYMIKRPDRHAVAPVARVTDPGSGIIMDVESNACCVQFYTGKFLDRKRLRGKSGKVYDAYGALCLECHGYPDGVNSPEIDDIILRPGETYEQTTVYRFSVA